MSDCKGEVEERPAETLVLGASVKISSDRSYSARGDGLEARITRWLFAAAGPRTTPKMKDPSQVAGIFAGAGGNGAEGS